MAFPTTFFSFKHTNKDKCQSDEKGENVASQGLVVLAKALAEPANSWVNIVFA